MVVAVEPDLDAREVLVVDREWRTFVNQEAHRLLGKAGTTLWELCPALESTSFGTAFRYAMSDRAELIRDNQGRSLTIEVGARAEGEMWSLYVKDDGVGIAPELHERIWGLFQTLEPRDKVESTGIGLAVVRKIVEARGGIAWVDSEVGTGATLWFTWPATDTPTRTRHG